MKGISSTRLVLLAAIGLAAATGYWSGSIPRKKAADENERVMSARARGEVVVNAPRLPPVNVVRETIKGSLDDREQWRQVRGFTEDEVKAAIGELGSPSRMMSLRHNLSAMLFSRWAEIDPVAANEAARELFPNQFSYERRAVIAAWIKQGGGVAAWNAVQGDGGIWDCTRTVSGEVADMLVASYSNLDDASAFKEVLQMNDENCDMADILCRARAKKAYATPESRAAFLAAAAKHPDEYVINTAREYLFREWAQRDPKAALAGVMELPISEEKRESLRDDVRREARTMEPAAAENP